MLAARWRSRLAPLRAHRHLIAFLLVILLAGLVATLVGRSIWAHRDYPFDSDEAIHANAGLAMALDLRAGDLPAFARTFYAQGFYPPAFSVVKALVFVIFGASPVVARFFSLGCLVAATAVLYVLGRRLDSENGWLVGLIAVALTLTSQPLLVESGLVMMEAPGLLVSFGMLLLYLGAIESPAAWRLAGTGVLLLCTFLTKYTYGLPAAVTVVLMEITRLLWPERDPAEADDRLRKGVRRWIWLAGPLVVGLLIWFAGPGKIAQFWDYATAQPAQHHWSLDAVVFYPRSVAFHHVPSPPFALLTLASLLWAALRWRDQKLRLLLLYFAIGMGEMFLNFPKNPRFIATFVPAAHVLTGAMLAQAALHPPRSSAQTWWRTGLAVLILIGLVTAVPVLRQRFGAYPSVMQVAYETDPGLNDLAAWIRAQIPPGGRFYLINFWDQFSPQALGWYLGTHDPPPGARFGDVSMPSALLQEATPDNIAALRQEILSSGAHYVVAFEGTPWGAPVWWIYADAMGDVLHPVAREIVYVDAYDTGGWLKRALLTRDGWERVKADGHYTLQVQTTIYAVAGP